MQLPQELLTTPHPEEGGKVTAEEAEDADPV